MGHEESKEPISPQQMARRRIRTCELRAAADYFACGQRVLDYGAGSGFVSSLIAQFGCEVEAIDVQTRPWMCWPVRLYDGVRLPYSDSAFDVVFTCFALEHLPDLSACLREMSRVLKPGGRMIHIVPTSSWRFWSNATHYLWFARLLRSRFAVRPSAQKETAHQEPRSPGHEEHSPARRRQHLWRLRELISKPKSTPKILAKLRTLGWLLVPPRHGELASSALTEIGQYRLSRWRQTFAEASLEVVAERPTGIFDVEHLLLTNISERARIRLAQFLGSSGYVFVLRPLYSGAANGGRARVMRALAS